MKIPGAQVRIRSCIFAGVALGATDAILGDTAMDDADTTVIGAADLAGQPDMPRNLTVKGNDANVSGDVVIEGTDAEGVFLTETIALNAANTVVGAKAFATVTSVTLPKYDTADTERVRIGTGAKLGLPVRLSRNTVIAAFLDDAREANAPTVAVSADTIAANTVTLNSALDGADVIVDLYETE